MKIIKGGCIDPKSYRLTRFEDSQTHNLLKIGGVKCKARPCGFYSLC